MSEVKKKRWATTALATLLLLYPLSSGPAYGLVVRGYFDLRYYKAAYRPFWWLAGQSRALLNACEWYTEVWEPPDA